MDKIPYGTKYARENLDQLFPAAEIIETSKYPSLLMNPDTGGNAALITISYQFAPTPEEMHALIRFAGAGNQLFIAATDIDDTLLRILDLKAEYVQRVDSGQISVLDPIRDQWMPYGYPGLVEESYFDSLNQTHAEVLGKNSRGKPDFIHLAYAHGGSIFIHLNPFAFTNYFLLHKQNQTYYESALSYIPRGTTRVEWSDYFRYQHGQQHFSALSFIWKNRALRWAFWLTILLFLLLFLVESKRKQRPVPVIPPLRNASEEFVKTVGRLYFQQRNNLNLAEKMVVAFLENIRVAYHIPTSVLNEEFENKLTFRSGKPPDQIRQLVSTIHQVRLNNSFSDQQLMDFHQQISQFTKPAP